ncbi:HAD family hydrolase [Schlegelella sp. ID0723]|uniref:HAD family hydrolase n=2 Tax=Piscinibacter koreensis TaxID=2742824 RepID=A0A7Y6NR91_9BURK|nr:HAD family hydrolase [Schlegelella koreensis]
MNDRPPLRALLLDIDGTLLDSNDAHARSWAQTLEQHGCPVPYERVRSLIGKGSDHLLPDLLGIDADGTLGERLVADRRRRFVADWLPKLAPTRGARELLERLKAAGIERVIATSAGESELDGLLRQAGIADLVDIATSSGDAEHSKPDPDIVCAALAKADLDAEAVLMLGDTPYDIEAARRAGVGTIALRSGGWWNDAALAGAVAIYDDPADLLAHWDESPLARRASRR